MKQIISQGGKVILLSFIAAFALSIVPLPGFLQMIRPEFVTIVLLYWCIALPARVGVGIAWVTGIIVDVLTDSLLGQHALTLSIVAFLAIKLHQRIRVFPVWQQAITIFVLLLFQATITMWIKGMLDEHANLMDFIIPALTTAIFWPPGYFVMRHVRRYYQVK